MPRFCYLDQAGLQRTIILDLGWVPVLSRILGASLLNVDLCVIPQVGMDERGNRAGGWAAG